MNKTHSYERWSEKESECTSVGEKITLYKSTSLNTIKQITCYGDHIYIYIPANFVSIVNWMRVVIMLFDSGIYIKWVSFVWHGSNGHIHTHTRSLTGGHFKSDTETESSWYESILWFGYYSIEIECPWIFYVPSQYTL